VKTYSARKGEVERSWWVVDASDKTLGRLASRIAKVLQGKDKPVYTPNIDTGDFVVVINAEKVRVTGKKGSQKSYHSHSGYPGGARSHTLKEMLGKHPERVIRRAVKGMLPKNRLARQQLRKLKVYAGAEHPHAAQQPRQMDIDQPGG
jgi:large subunit ribosomal protein L13